VTRIISGFAGSLPLSVPTSGTRPTSDRVREAVFSALDARDSINGATVLDLYAGSGALGLEAASRGAAHVTLVEKNPAAVAVAKKNAARIRDRAPRGATLRVDVVGQAVNVFLAGAAKTAVAGATKTAVAGAPNSALAYWDLVFMDPPYDLGTAELDEALVALSATMTAGAILVLERGSRSPEPAWPIGLELERRKDYGDTAVFWVRRAVPRGDDTERRSR